jgi:DNA sulfur modification protein DndD
MRLQKIEIENFRQYFGMQNLQFANTKTKNVTVIHGINGAGKTSLFLAINWCLYGRGSEGIKVIDNNVGDLVSKEAVKQAEAGAKIQTSVTITFMDDGYRYIIKRSIRGEKLRSGEFILEPSDQCTMHRQSPSGKTEPISNPVGHMNSVLPINAREYFLFDGEKIDNFAKPEAADQVKEAIYLVLKLEILERAKRHLQKTADNYRRELKQASGGELKDLLTQEEKLRNQRESDKARKLEQEATIISAERKIRDIEERLREAQDTQFLQQKRDLLQNNLETRERDLEETEKIIRDKVTSGYAVLAKPAIERALALLNEKREKGEIPSNIRQQFVQDLLDQMMCVCGRPFSEHGPEYTKLSNLLTHSFPNSLEDDVLNTSGLLTSFATKNGQRQLEIDQHMQRRANAKAEIAQLAGQLDDISRQLEGSPLEEIRRLEKQKQDFQHDVSKANIEIGALGQRIAQQDKEIAQLQKQIERARREEQKSLLLSTKYDLAQQAADAIASMYDAHADNMRQKIETRTKEIFRTLIWKDAHFEDVCLGTDYNLEVIDRYGKPSRSDLSAGERQVLSLSFIAAMAQVSEEEAPIVMDTPFGRLSSHHRNSITANLPKLANQLVLFVTDEELRDQARTNLEPFIGAEYRLNFERSSSCTTIEAIHG